MPLYETRKAVGTGILPGTYTVDTLPPAADNMDFYATVTDLFGSKRDKVLASQVDGVAFWQPVRPVFAKAMTLSGNVTLTALKSPSVLFVKGSGTAGVLTGNVNITLSPTLAYPGASFEIRMDGTLGLFGLNLLGLNIGTPLAILAGGTRRVFYDQDGWKQFT